MLQRSLFGVRLLSPRALQNEMAKGGLTVLEAGGQFAAQHKLGLPSSAPWACGDLKSPETGGFWSPEAIAESAADAGVTAGRRVVVFDAGQATMACRAAIALKYCGVDNVDILGGGLSVWQQDGFDLCPSADAVPSVDELDVKVDTSWLATTDDVLSALEAGTLQVLDVRSPEEFDGSDLHGNPRGGHIPGAVNYPVNELYRGRFTDPDWVRHRLNTDRRSSGDHPVVVTCQSGFRAAVGVIALRMAGIPAALHDAGMAEWSQSGNPMES